MRVLIAVFLTVLVFSVFPDTGYPNTSDQEGYSKTGIQNVICGRSCWGSIGEGWIEPEQLPPGIADGVRGGDGAECSLSEVLDGCGPDDIHISPCAGALCDGDEGNDGPSLICDFYCLRFPNVVYHYVGYGDPWSDNSGDPPPFDCQLAWDDPSNYPDWPSGCRLLNRLVG